MRKSVPFASAAGIPKTYLAAKPRLVAVREVHQSAWLGTPDMGLHLFRERLDRSMSGQRERLTRCQQPIPEGAAPFRNLHLVIVLDAVAILALLAGDRGRL